MPSTASGSRSSDLTGSDTVSKSSVVSELDSIWTKINALLTALGTSIRDDDSLASDAVRERCIHPELVALINAGTTLRDGVVASVIQRVAEYDLSGESAVEIAAPADSNRWRLMLTDLVPSVDAYPLLTVSDDSAATYESTGYDLMRVIAGVTEALAKGASSAAANWALQGTVAIDSAGSADYEVDFLGVVNSRLRTRFQGAYRSGAGDDVVLYGYGSRSQTAQATHIKLALNTGTFVSGKAHVLLLPE